MELLPYWPAVLFQWIERARRTLSFLGAELYRPPSQKLLQRGQVTSIRPEAPLYFRMEIDPAVGGPCLCSQRAGRGDCVSYLPPLSYRLLHLIFSVQSNFIQTYRRPRGVFSLCSHLFRPRGQRRME